MTADEERCPSCGASVGEIIRVRYQGRLTQIRYLEPDGQGGQLEMDHVCGDQ